MDMAPYLSKAYRCPQCRGEPVFILTFLSYHEYYCKRCLYRFGILKEESSYRFIDDEHWVWCSDPNLKTFAVKSPGGDANELARNN